MTRPFAAPAESHRPFYRHWAWWCTLVVLVLIAIIRLRLLELALERDEGEYAYTGQLMLQGIPPYQLVYNMKFPGTYAAYAVIMALFGQTTAGIHFGVMCITTLTALMLYWFGRRFFNEPAGMVAATTYAVLAASPKMLGLAGHATHFCALFVTAGLCFLWPVGRSLNWKNAAAGGFLLGVAVIMKQHAALFCPWGLGVLAVNCWRQSKAPAAERLLPCAVFLFWSRLAVPTDLFGFVACRRVRSILVLDHQLCRIICFGTAFVADTQNFLSCLFSNHPAHDPPVAGSRGWPGSALAARPVPECAPADVELCLNLVSGRLPGFYFRLHYFLLMLPAWHFVGLAADVVPQLRRSGTGSAKTISWPFLAYGLALAVTVFANREIWFQSTPVQAAHKIYFGNPFIESEVVSDFIRTNSAPDARIAVFGSEPQIYFLSRRHSATGYIYMYPLMEPQPFADQMQQEMIRQIESARPEYTIAVLVSASWVPRPGADERLFNWWSHSYVTNLTLVGVVALDPPNESHYFWGPEVSNYPGLPQRGILVYQRKASE